MYEHNKGCDAATVLYGPLHSGDVHLRLQPRLRPSFIHAALPPPQRSVKCNGDGRRCLSPWSERASLSIYPAWRASSSDWRWTAGRARRTIETFFEPLAPIHYTILYLWKVGKARIYLLKNHSSPLLLVVRSRRRRRPTFSHLPTSISFMDREQCNAPAGAYWCWRVKRIISFLLQPGRVQLNSATSFSSLPTHSDLQCDENEIDFCHRLFFSSFFPFSRCNILRKRGTSLDCLRSSRQRVIHRARHSSYRVLPSTRYLSIGSMSALIGHRRRVGWWRNGVVNFPRHAGYVTEAGRYAVGRSIEYGER